MFHEWAFFQMDLHFALNELHNTLLIQIYNGQHAHREFQF